MSADKNWIHGRLKTVVLLLLLTPIIVHAQTIASTAPETEAEQSVAKAGIPCESGSTPDGQSGDTGTDSDACNSDESLSNYDETISDGNSVQSVEAELAAGDEIKPAIFPIDMVHSRLKHLYNFKDKINSTFGLAFGVDYSALLQHSSFTESGENTAASQVFRILGTWLQFGTPEGNMGNLVWKTETRTTLGGNPTPRDMGFDTGSALSTANYKELDYWGITDLYWKQRLQGGKYAFLAGHMDPGDWADQYPLLNAWTSFMNDAFYNNPTEAIPKRGFGLVGQMFLTKNTYLMAGVHDANGKDGKLDFSSFWDTRELFSWVEYGYRGERDISARQNAHIHFWHQDQREEAATEKSWGVVYTHSVVTKNDGVAFIRAGYSEGDAAQMRCFVGIGMSYKPLGRDTLGIATSWGSPPDKSLRDQITSEVFYRVQVTQNFSLSPNFQLTYRPSYTLEEKWVFIPGLRIRMVF